MRKFLGTFTLILLSTAVAFSQGRDDHDPVLRVGYAVVTPVTTSGTAQMVVFETFGLRRTAETTQASILPTALTSSAVLFVSTSGRLDRNLGVAIVNPNSTSTSVTMALRRADGTLLASVPATIAAREHRADFVTQLFPNQAAVQNEFEGTLTITASQPISALGLRFRGLNFSTLPVTSLTAGSPVPTIATGVGGTGAVLIPHVAVGGSWATQIVIANTGTTSLTVRVDLFGRDGAPLATGLNGTTNSSFQNIVIPAGGVHSLAPRNTLGDDDF